MTTLHSKSEVFDPTWPKHITNKAPDDAVTFPRLTKTFQGLRITALVGLLGACAQTSIPRDSPTPSTPVPSELVGSWFMGDLANIDYYDPYTGSWSDPGGYGIFFSFNEDGRYEHGAVFSSTVYSCTSKVLSFEKGMAEVDGETLVTHLQTGKASWSDTCGESGENAYGPEDTTWTWSLGPDAYGQETLTLVKVDGSLHGEFQRWDRE